MPFIRSISGLRATGDCLGAGTIENYARAFDKFLPEGAVVIGRDGRLGSDEIVDQIIRALSGSGRRIFRLDVVPTPTVQIYVELLGAAGGIAVTASHNPAEWNGMKFINSSGQFLDLAENQMFWEIVDRHEAFDPPGRATVIKKINFAVGAHADAVLHLPLFAADGRLGQIYEKHYKVVVDAVNASGSVAIPYLLEKLGCRVVPLYCDSSGIFPHAPEPVPANLTALAAAVAGHGADLGVAVDPDADRLVLIDENGNQAGEEYTIALAVESVLRSFKEFTAYREPRVVVNHSTSQLVEDIASKYSAKVLRAPVGEINVVRKMIECGAVVGGEGSGGVILPDCHYGRDSLVGTALVLDLMASMNMKLSEIIAQYPKYSMIKTKFAFSDDLGKYRNKIIAAFPGCQLNDEDGFKVILDRSWVQVRASNTEPIVRIIAETGGSAHSLEMIEMLKSALGIIE